jgi:lipopolysaccharide export system protein LptA
MKRSIVPALLVLALSASFAAPPAFAQATTELFAGFGGKSKEPIEVEAKTLDVFEEGEQRVSVFSGNVTVRRGNTTMKASQIKIFSDKKGGRANTFNLMEASGTVYVHSVDQTVTGKRAVVDNKSQTITLTGDVVLSQGENVIVGEKLVVDMQTGKARLVQTEDRPIRMILTPDGKAKAGAKGGKKAAPEAEPVTN